MQKVVDSNSLQDAATRDYLSARTRNRVVLTDYVMMEAYKSGSVTGLQKSMSLLQDYSSQVDVLRGIRSICELPTSGTGYSRLMIDDEATAEFPDFCAQLALLREGDDRSLQAIQRLVDHSREHLDQMAQRYATLAENIDQIAEDLPAAGLAALRRGEPFSKEMGYRIQDHVMDLAANIFRAQPTFVRGIELDTYFSRFVFRSAVTAYALTLDRLSDGGASLARAENLRNDVVDSTIAAYATYFDGLITEDARMARVHDHACIMMKTLFGQVAGPL